MRGSLASALIAMTLLAPAPAEATTVDQTYRQALQHYYRGRYGRAIAEMERVARLPTRNEDLYYNLGCAYYRAGQLGRAIYNFERSLRLAPDRDDARFNLATAREAAAARIKDVLKGVPNDPFWVRAVSAMSLAAWALCFLVAWWALFALLFFLRRLETGPLRAGVLASLMLVLLISAGSALMLGGRAYADSHRRVGVILPDQVAVKEGPSTSAKASFSLHAGLRVNLRKRDGSWLRVRLANGLEGWVKDSDVGMLN